MATKLRGILDTHRLNYHFTQWPESVLDPFEIADHIVQKFTQERATIDANAHLTSEGKRAARRSAAEKALKSLDDWHTPRLSGLDEDLSAHRAALMPTSSDKIDPRRLDFLLSHLRDKTELEISVLYNNATPEDQVALEHAANVVGRMPRKTADGGLVWASLLSADAINENVIARATAKNPQGAQKLEELAEIRAMQVTVANVAAAEIREILSE
jgi:hypothetical protein